MNRENERGPGGGGGVMVFFLIFLPELWVLLILMRARLPHGRHFNRFPAASACRQRRGDFETRRHSRLSAALPQELQSPQCRGSKAGRSPRLQCKHAGNSSRLARGGGHAQVPFGLTQPAREETLQRPWAQEGEMLPAAGRKAGSCGGWAVREELRAPLLLASCRSHVASHGAHDRGVSRQADGRTLGSNARPSTSWRQVGKPPGEGTPVQSSGHRGYGQKLKGSSIQHEGADVCHAPCERCQQGMGTLGLWIHQNQYQAFNRALTHPDSKWQSLTAIPKRSWFSRIESRCYSLAAPHSPLLPWWPPWHTPLAPAHRVCAHSYQTTSLPAGAEHHVVDLRSDTVTRPSPEMRRAMAQAEVGDDDYGEDPTVNELQSVVADLLGKEEALFVPTATMANLIAVMCHCCRRGAQVLLGKEAHIHVFEHGGVAQVAGVHAEVLQNLPDGTISLDELEHKIQQSQGSQYHPRPELICLENTHCSAGGRILPLRYLQEVCQLTQQYGLQIHLDGARVLNAAVALGVLPSHITQHCDSVSLCLSKGVGAPVGALLAGRREFIAEAWRMRKLLGGGMRQAGVLAAAALTGLRCMEETLQRDHHNARSFAEGVCDLGSPLCSVNTASVETNIVMMTASAPWLAPAKLCELMATVSAEEVAATGQAVSVRLFPWHDHSLRAVWHCDVSAHDTQLAGNKLRFVLDKCERERACGS